MTGGNMGNYTLKKMKSCKASVFVVLVTLFVSARVYSWEMINTPPSYSHYFLEMSEQNYLPHFLDALEKMHGITVYLHVHAGKEKIDLKKTADFLLREKTGGTEGRQIYIIAAPKMRKTAFAFSSEAQRLFKPDDLRLLEEHAAPALLGRWFIPERRALSKITGTLYYYLERDNMDAAQMKIIKEQAVITDNGWYRASLTEPFNTFIKLFYFEPLSFIYYFPLVTFFLFARIPGMYLGWYAYRNLSIVWAGFMVIMAAMMGARVSAYVPEYIRWFSLFAGLNIPLYLYVMAFYSNEIKHAAYNYITEIKGGFAAENEFEGRRWS